MSKIVERVVAQQLHEYLAINDLLPRNQSAYCRHHSTETAMLRVISDALSEADEQRVTLLASPDMTAAYDCVDHSLFTALHVMQTRYCDELSVRPSVCPSVGHMREL